MRRARIRTTHDAATLVASALEPDNTDAMTTRVEGDAVVTTIDRETTGGLHASVDDYVVNLTVADRLAGTAASNPATRTETNSETNEPTSKGSTTPGTDTDTRPDTPDTDTRHE